MAIVGAFPLWLLTILYLFHHYELHTSFSDVLFIYDTQYHMITPLKKTAWYVRLATREGPGSRRSLIRWPCLGLCLCFLSAVQTHEGRLVTLVTGHHITMFSWETAGSGILWLLLDMYHSLNIIANQRPIRAMPPILIGPPWPQSITFWNGLKNITKAGGFDLCLQTLHIPIQSRSWRNAMKPWMKLRTQPLLVSSQTGHQYKASL